MAVEMFALSFSPKTSGPSEKGRLRMYSMYSASELVPGGTSSPVSSTMRMAVCISALPAEPTLRMASAASSMVPAGLVSVMPQPWTSGTPRAFQPSRMASAQGAPPTPASRSRERSAPGNFGCCIMN